MIVESNLGLTADAGERQPYALVGVDDSGITEGTTERMRPVKSGSPPSLQRHGMVMRHEEHGLPPLPPLFRGVRGGPRRNNGSHSHGPRNRIRCGYMVQLHEDGTIRLQGQLRSWSDYGRPGGSEKRKRWAIVASTSGNSIRANVLPMHTRCPPPKGK